MVGDGREEDDARFVAAESQVIPEGVRERRLQASSGMVREGSQAMPERATADSQAMMSDSVTADSRAPVAQGAASPAAPPPAAPARESRTAQKAADASVAVSDRGGQVVAEATPSRETREATAARSAPAAPPRAAQSAVLAQQVREPVELVTGAVASVDHRMVVAFVMAAVRSRQGSGGWRARRLLRLG